MTSLKQVFQGMSYKNALDIEYGMAYQLMIKYYLGELNSQDLSTIFSYDGACLERYHDVAFLYRTLSDFLEGRNDIVYNCQPPNIREQTEGKGFLAYPNPTENHINIEFEKPFTGEVKTYNVLGQLVYRKEIKEASVDKLEIRNLKPGQYYLKMDKELYSGMKVIKL